MQKARNGRMDMDDDGEYICIKKRQNSIKTKHEDAMKK
jgi:hypothetical protein